MEIDVDKTAKGKHERLAALRCDSHATHWDRLEDLLPAR